MNKDCWWCRHLLYFSTTTQEQKICNKQTTINNLFNMHSSLMFFYVALSSGPLFESRTARFQHQALAQLPEVHFIRTPKNKAEKATMATTPLRIQ